MTPTPIGRCYACGTALAQREHECIRDAARCVLCGGPSVEHACSERWLCPGGCSLDSLAAAHGGKPYLHGLDAHD
jgi:hypothetical protein